LQAAPRSMLRNGNDTNRERAPRRGETPRAED
jgi:hypothetical protein